MLAESPYPDGIVMVPVPVQHLPAVYKLLGEVAALPSEPDDEGSILVDEVQGHWTPTMIERLNANLHLEGVRLMLDEVAKVAPAEVSMQAGAAAWGKTNKHLGAQMGALTKLAKSLFGKATWPMHVRYNDQGQAFYSMPKPIAELWLEVGQ